ncbi:MAG: hypothetical protein HY720_04360 [Planctomycetes bacterium]|nr:hypothetical protein [Planctomycetota bacterium]
MGKPIRAVQISALKGQWRTVNAVFDKGTFRSFIAESAVPAGSSILSYDRPELAPTAKGGPIRITGVIFLLVRIGKKEIHDGFHISPDLPYELLIGAITMRPWRISIRKAGCRTRVVVGNDRRDPDLMAVE